MPTARAGRTAKLHPSTLTPLHRAVLLACLAIGMVATSTLAKAQATAAPSSPAATVYYDLPAGTLDQVLNRFATSAGILLSIDGALTAGKSSPGLQGSYDVQGGLTALLAGSGLEAVASADGGYVLRRLVATVPTDEAARRRGEGGEVTLPQVTVTARAARPGDLPEAYAGGQVARGGRLGLLGNVDVMDAPFNITSYTAKTIEDQQGRNLADLVGRNDPSVRVYGGEQEDSDRLRIRGFDVGMSSGSFDGLPGLLGYMRSGTEFAERIEVLKGPSAMLGVSPSGDVGGTVNVVPKRAGDAPLTRLTTRYLSDSRLGLHADIGRRFGADNAWGIRVNGALLKGEAARDFHKQSHAQSSVALDYRGERLRASLDYVRQSMRDDGVSNQIVRIGAVGMVPRAPTGATSLAQPWSVARNGSRMLVGRLEYDITPDLTVHAALGRTKGWLLAKSSGFLSLASLSGDTLGTPSRNAYRGDMTSGELGATGRFVTGPVRHRWSISLTALKGEEFLGFGAPADRLVSNIYAPTYSPEPSFMEEPVARLSSRRRLPSLGIADTLSFIDDRVKLTLGLRRQAVKEEGFDYRSTGQLSSRYDESAISPFTGLVVKSWQGGAIYANAIEGLTQGGVAPDGAANAGESLPPYKSRQYELGIKQEGGGIGASASVFQIAQRSGMVDPVNNRYTDAGEQRHRGVELNVFGELARRVRVLGGATWIDAKIAKTATASLQGNRPLGVPRFTANLGGEWDMSAVSGLTLTAAVVYTGTQYVDAANTMRMPSWTRTDLGGRWATYVAQRPVTLRASLENAFNKHYWASTNYGYLLRGMPRTLLLSASIDL